MTQLTFHNRRRELQLLESRWVSGRAELIVVSGRRRIGKTYLLRRFSETVPAVYYPAARLPEAQQLRELGDLFGRFLQDELLRENGFASWDQLLRLLARLPDRVLVVLDEYPYLVESNPGLSSLVQRAWDQELSRSDVMLVLCGSSVAMMEQETLDATAPLHGRRTGHLRLDPMTVAEAAEFLPGWCDDDLVRAYAVFGGVPHYLAQMDPVASLESNVLELVLRMGAPLRDEVDFLLRQELSQARVYLGILASIAAGRRKMAELANATGLPATTVSRYLGTLQRLGLVEREVPVTEARPEKSKRGLYRILDPFIEFWLRHVLPHRGLLEAGREQEALSSIMASFERSVPATYEEICRSIVRRGLLDEVTGHRWARVGRWWSRLAEIDLLGFSADSEHLLVGEANWSARAVGAEFLEHLQASVQQLPKDLSQQSIQWALFSRSGFTDHVRRAAVSRDDLTLITGLSPEA